jgi:hypothetical protein
MTVHPYTRLFVKALSPTADDDVTEGYEVGDVWVVIGSGIYQCIDTTDGAAVWQEDGASTGPTTEEIQDIVGAMLAGNGTTGLTITYDDGAGEVNFSVIAITDVVQSNSDNISILQDNVTDGWINLLTHNWTRTGDHQFTVATDLTATYRKGAKVRYQDGGGVWEYGVIASSSYSAPNTTVNLIPNSDYAMAAATITGEGISYVESPEGFPASFTFDPGWTNLSGGTQVAEWKANGNQVHWEVLVVGATISGQVAFVLPVLPLTATSSTRVCVGIASILDSGTANYPGTVIVQGTGTRNAEPRAINASGTYGTNTPVNATVPFAWGASDELNMIGDYLF